MKTVKLKAVGNAIIQTQQRLLDAMLSKDVQVKMLCKGRGICATCHVYVTANPQMLTPVTEREKMSLSLLTGAQQNSRLACQARVVGEGIEVEMPRGLYVESLTDLEQLIGKRSNVPILHPINGRVLIQENKIITRTAIMQLQDVDFNISQLDVNR